MIITKRFLILVVSVSLISAFIATSGCERTEIPKRPEVSAASPAQQSPSPSAAVTSAPQQPESSVTPSTLPPAGTPVSAPAPCMPASAPDTAAPALPAKPKPADIIRVAVFDSAQIQDGAPVGWTLQLKAGDPALSLERGSRIYYLHMKSNASSFGVRRGIKVDIKEYPYLNWRWKAAKLPDGGDVRKSDKDDQALQLYVAFTPTGFPEALNTPVLSYIWDNEAPKGWTGRSSHIGGGNLRYVVVRDGSDNLGQWYTEKRNIYEDYKNLLKDVKCAEPPGITLGVELYINSQNTKSTAESYIGDIYFSKR